MSESVIYVTNPGEGVCIGGRFNGWLMRRHPDGQWVSVRKLETVNPADSLPDWMKALTTPTPGAPNAE